MYGWRGIIGHAAPSRGDTLVYEFYHAAPKGTALFNNTGSIRKIDGEDIAKQTQRMEDSSRDLVEAGAGVVFVGGDPIFTTLGYDSHEEFTERLTESSGKPIKTTIGAAVEAMRELGLKRVIIASPYEPEFIHKSKIFLEQAGFEVTGEKGLGIRKNSEIGHLPAYASYAIAKEAFAATPEADGIYLPCSRWPTLECIEALERDTGIPAITSSMSVIWSGLKTLNVREEIRGYGKLLSSLGG